MPPDESYKGLPLSYEYVVTTKIDGVHYDSLHIALGNISDFKLHLNGTLSIREATGTIKNFTVK